MGARLLLPWLMFAVTVTLGPFDFEAASPEIGFFVLGSGSGQHHALHLLLNVLLFVPLGAYVHRAGHRRSLKLLPILTLVGAAAFLMSFALESLQRFLPGRESSLIDLAANVAGALAGVFGSRAWGTSIARRFNELRASTSSAALASALASLMVFTLLTSGALQVRSRLSNWSPAYPLLIGNEETGDRPWRGRVFSLVITDAATPLLDARRFAAGDAVVLPGSRIGAFDFTGKAPYRDAAGNLPDLNWTQPAAKLLDGRTAPTVAPWLQSDHPASHIVDRVEVTNAFTLRVKCATDERRQAGPARIVSNSASPSVRNFTIGQNGSDLVIRLRTPLTGLNGFPLETIVPEVFTDGDPRDILVAYDGASLIAAVSPKKRIVRTELTPGLGAALALAPENTDLAHQQNYKVWYLVALFLGPGVLIALFGRTSRDRLDFCVVYVVTAAIAMEGTLMLASGRAFDWVNAGVTGGVATVVLAVTGGVTPLQDGARE